jgi:hypothetical protein
MVKANPRANPAGEELIDFIGFQLAEYRAAEAIIQAIPSFERQIRWIIIFDLRRLAGKLAHAQVIGK